MIIVSIIVYGFIGFFGKGLFLCEFQCVLGIVVGCISKELVCDLGMQLGMVGKCVLVVIIKFGVICCVVLVVEVMCCGFILFVVIVFVFFVVGQLLFNDDYMMCSCWGGECWIEF